MPLTCWRMARLAPLSVGEGPTTAAPMSRVDEAGSLPDRTVQVVTGTLTVIPADSHGPKSHVSVMVSVGSSGEKSLPRGMSCPQSVGFVTVFRGGGHVSKSRRAGDVTWTRGGGHVR